MTEEPSTDPSGDAIAVERMTGVTDELLEAVLRLFPQLTKSPVPDEASIARVLQEGALILVARSDGAIVGMGTIVIATALTGITGHVEDVVVDANVRGRGIGGRLMRELIEIACAEGADQVTLTSHPSREAANRLYQRLGFELGGTNYYTLDLDAAKQTVEKRRD